MKRTTAMALVVAAGAVGSLYITNASAQPAPAPAPAPVPKAPAPKAPPAPAPKAPPAAPAPKAPAAPPPGTPIKPKPDTKGAEPTKGLPAGHPPLGPGRQIPESLRKRMEALRKAQAAQNGQAQAAPHGLAPAVPAGPAAKPREPRDEHGLCLGDGHNDRPKDINLFHGWLGVNNDKAVPPPSPKGSGEWWKWRLTPHPYRYENHDDHCDRRNQPIPLLANVINVGVLLFLLVRFGRRPMGEALKKRRASIMEEIDRAQEIKKSAKARLEKYEDELDNLDGRLEELRDQYKAEGEVEEKHVRQEMAETRDRLLADAAFRISQEQKTARDDLSRQALEDALAAAETLLGSAIGRADHDRLEEEYLDQLGEALNSKNGGAA